MIFLCITLIAVSILAGGCGGRLVNADRRGEVRWGEPVDGLQPGLSVNQYRPGKQARLVVTYVIRNVGEEPMRVMGLRHYAGPTRYFPGRGPVEVNDRSSRPRRVEPLAEGSPPASGYDFLEPGEQMTLTSGIDPGHYRQGGVFDVNVTFVYELKPPPIAPTVGDANNATRLWSGRAESAPVKAKVRF
ncbi:MAG: hypothetical protein M3478_11090 [Planctomycetota bacterium]|nr:hypothetical protein [Planctomycetota bacterium]